MARDRQRAKRRQAERRAARLRDRGRAAGQGRGRDGTAPPESPGERSDGGEPAELTLDPLTRSRAAAGAPPEEAGRSDTVVEAPPPAPHLEEDREPRAEEARAVEPRERERGRVLAFLAAVWAELHRVQWPERKTLTTLTGVVLGFVLLAGGYLGALDAMFSRLIQSIL